MEQPNITLFAKRFFSGTLLSRISGLGRDLAMAFAFGDHPSVAAFMVAFRLSNLFRRLLGEGPLQSAFIPQFEELRLKDERKAHFFFRKLVVLIATLLICLTALFEGAALLFVNHLSEGVQEIVWLMAYLMPGIVFICLYGINISLLNCCDTFFIPSVAPAICNGIWILAALFLKFWEPNLAMPILAKWVVIGLFGQWLMTLPFTIKNAGAFSKSDFNFKLPEEVKTLIKSFSLGAVGVGAVQVNAMADAIFARLADIKGPVYLWYSIRLEQLVLAIFGILCVNTIAPSLSRAIKGGEISQAEKLFSLSFKRIMSLMIPCTFACIALGLSAVNLVYGRGSFSPYAVQKTALCLWAYGAALVPSVLIILYSTVFYAQNNFKLPMQVSLCIVALNLVLNYLFVCIFHFGAISTALATSLSAWINCFVLYKLTLRSGWNSHFSRKRLFHLVMASFFASLAACAVGHFTSTLDLPRLTVAQLFNFVIQSTSFLATFLAYAVIFKCQDILDFLQIRSRTPSKGVN